MTDDLISRQEALDNYCDVCVGVSCVDCPFCKDIVLGGCKLCDYIDNLPSAQPEQRWVPVTERLPEKEKRHYWVCTNTGYQCQCRWTNDVFGFGDSDFWEWKVFDIPPYQKVVAWMPLPEPWKGVE